MANGPQPGFLTTPESQDGRLASQPSPMYSHGFGTLFLSEVCGMLPAAVRDTKVRSALDQAVAFTVAAQNQEGGWRYEPVAQFADVSVTVAQMMALRAARNAGLFVRKNVMEQRGQLHQGLPDARRRVQLLEGAGLLGVRPHARRPSSGYTRPASTRARRSSAG